MKKQARATVLLALLGSACGTQVDEDYKGDVQGTLRGELTLASADAAPTEPMRVEIVWLNTAGSPDTSVGQAVDVDGEFPLGFRMDLVEPPPPEALNDYTKGGALSEEGRIGIGYIIAYPESLEDLVLPASSGEEEEAEIAAAGAVFGAASRHVVAYVEKDLVPGSFSAALVGGALKEGFHLLESTPSTATEEEVDAYDAACERPEGVCDAEWDAAIAAAENADEGEVPPEVAAYLQCGYAWAKENDCLRTNPIFDSLAPAKDGFDTVVDITLGSDVNDLEVPNWT